MFEVASILEIDYLCKNKRFIAFWIEFEIQNNLYRSALSFYYTDNQFKVGFVRLTDAMKCPFCETKCWSRTENCKVLNSKENLEHLKIQFLTRSEIWECLESEKNPHRIRMALRGAFLKKLKNIL